MKCEPQKQLGFTELDQELWLAKRVTQLLTAVFSGDTDRPTRMARIRTGIVAGGLSTAIAGKGPSGRAETLSELFRRVYGEDLEPKPQKGK